MKEAQKRRPQGSPPLSTSTPASTMNGPEKPHRSHSRGGGRADWSGDPCGRLLAFPSYSPCPSDSLRKERCRGRATGYLSPDGIAPWRQDIVNGPDRHLRLRDAHALCYWSQHTQEGIERFLRLPYVKDAPAPLDGAGSVIKIALWAVSAEIKHRYNLVVLLLRPARKILHYCDCHRMLPPLNIKNIFTHGGSFWQRLCQFRPHSISFTGVTIPEEKQNEDSIGVSLRYHCSFWIGSLASFCHSVYT